MDGQPEPFLHGLIDSDGWRGVNRVHIKGREHEYPRYQFSNRSQDIKDIFTRTCDLLGIEWRPWGRHHISGGEPRERGADGRVHRAEVVSRTVRA